MKSIKLKLVSELICLLLFSYLYSAFDNFSSGAKPMSMSGAFVGSPGDIYSIYYNPAGLVEVDKISFLVDYNKLYYGLSDNSDILCNSIAVAIPVKKITIGLNYQNFNVIDIYNENMMKMTVANNISDKLLAGLNIKLLSQEYYLNEYYIDDLLFKNGNTNTTYDFDIGLKFKNIGNSNLTLGLSVFNVLQNEYGFDENNKPKLARTLCTGISYQQKDFNLNFDIKHRLYNVSSNNNYFKEELVMCFGIEKWFNKVVLRTGLGWDLGYLLSHPSNRNYKNVSAGFGLNFDKFIIDYGFIIPVNEIENANGIHNLSLIIQFSKSKKKTIKSSKSITKEYPVNIVEKHLSREKKETVKIEKIEQKLTTTTTNVMKLPGISEKTEVIQPAISTDVPKIPISVSTVTNISSLIYSTYSVEVTSISLNQILKQKKKITEINITEPKTVEKPDKLIQQKYVVQKGDTLLSIAEKVYNDKRKWIKIYNANKDIIEKGIVKPDQVLIIP